MLLFLVLISCISSIHTQSQSSNKGAAKSEIPGCILPPQPKNGLYEVLEPEIPTSPGETLHNYTLEVTCDPGYHNTKSAVHLCFDGKTLWDMSECLPYCSTAVPEIVSCGVGVTGEETRCLLRDDLLDLQVRSQTEPEETLDEYCGTKEQFAAIIAGGRVARQQELPWHAGIYTKTTHPYKQICGGSLVSETVVISAAHCFWNDIEKHLPASNYAVAVGKIYRPWNDQHDDKAQKSDVKVIKIPPRFQGSATNLQDDIAVVVVATPFKFTSAVKPVCLDFDVNLDRQQTAPGNEGQVSGWGLTSENGRESPVLKVVEMPIVDIGDCIDKSDPSFRVHITSDKICAGYQNGTAVCKGDSGGGLSFPQIIHGRTHYFLRGVVSAAPGSQSLCNTYAWATFTHVLKHEHFIRETLPAKSSSTTAAVSVAALPSTFLQSEASAASSLTETDMFRK